ncbi:MAG: hypothetical protein ACYCX3_04070 [Thermoleophilia bacterium]
MSARRGTVRRRGGSPPTVWALLSALMLIVSGCAPLIESAPRAGAAADLSAAPAAVSTTSTSTPAAVVSLAPPIWEEPPPMADDGGEWRTLTLTRGGDAHLSPAVDDHYVVWQGRDSRSPDIARHYDEIYLYDLLTAETRMLSDNEVEDISPQIAGEWVVWLRYTEGTAGVGLVAHSLASGATKVLSSDVAAAGASSPGGHRDFVLAGGSVVWTAGVWPDTEIHRYDLWKGVEAVVSDGHGRNRSPDSDGRWVVWLSQTAEGDAVMLADPLLGRSWVVADVTPGQGAPPQVDGGLVVWSDWDGSDVEIFLDTRLTSEGARAEPVRLTDNDVDDLAPRLDGGMVVWREGRPRDALSPGSPAPSPGPPAPSRIVLFEYGIGKERVLASDVHSEAFPDVTDGLVSWKAARDEGEGIVLYDSALEQTVALGTKIGGAGYPAAVGAGRLVWSAWEGGAPQITLAYLGVRPPAPAPVDVEVSFVDTAATSYAGAIETLKAAGVIDPPTPAVVTSTTGDPPVSTPRAFHPESSVTRGDALEMVTVALGSVPSQGDPGRALTRGQLISLVVRALRANHPGAVALLPVGFQGTVNYSDPNHGDELLLAERNSLLDGLVGFRFDWDVWRPVTRGETAQILANALDRIQRKEGPAATVAASVPPSVGDSVGLLALPALSPEETVRLVRERGSWRLASSELRIDAVKVSPDSRGLQTLDVTLEATRPDVPSSAVGAFMDRSMGGVAAVASVLNASHGAQIGLVRVGLTGAAGVALVSYTHDLETREMTLKWDPSVEDVAQNHFPWSRPAPSGGRSSTTSTGGGVTF